MLSGTYPILPLSATPQVYLEAFHAERATEDPIADDPDALDEVETQRIYATYEGAKLRALCVGGLKGHDRQAAALLVGIDELDQFLGGGLTIGGKDDLLRKLDSEEMEPLLVVRRLLEDLLDWHFQNGAGALLPIADWLGLVRKPERLAS